MTRLFVPLLLVLAVYALVRGIADIRGGRKVWGTIGVLLAVTVAGAMMLPLETHATAVGIPRN
jgi:predicted Co/Zn/Cd cation transporter (cation efflux family)